MEEAKKRIWAELKKIVLAQNPDLKDVRPEQKPFDELGYDSLRTMELIVRMEKTFGIEIRGSDGSRTNFETFDQVMNLILLRQKRR